MEFYDILLAKKLSGGSGGGGGGDSAPRPTIVFTIINETSGNVIQDDIYIEDGVYKYLYGGIAPNTTVKMEILAPLGLGDDGVYSCHEPFLMGAAGESTFSNLVNCRYNENSSMYDVIDPTQPASATIRFYKS